MQTPASESSSKPALTAIAKGPDSQSQSASVPSAPSIAAITSQSGQPSTSSQSNSSGPSPAEGLTNKSEAAPSDDAKAEPIPATPMISKSAQLQAQIQALASLQSRITNIRRIPTHLLIFHPQSPLLSLDGLADLGMSLSGGTNAGTGYRTLINTVTSPLSSDGASAKVQGMGSQAHAAFRMLSEARDELLKSATQDALKTVRESEARDKTGIKLFGRRERKRRRIATADSPAPFPSFQLQTTNFFPPLQQKSRNISSLEDIPLFIREHNKARAELECGTESPRTRLGIWKQSRPKAGAPRRVSDPLTVRVAIHDVAIVFVKLTHRRTDDGNGGGQPIIEGVVALGPREKKSPHSHSDFTVYQKLTQQITRMVEKEPTVSFPQLVDFLTSYEDLFVAQCSICGRVLSQEGHVPPVARVWADNPSTNDGGRGRWAARHISCLHA
ncbi:hypothetical protein M0805_006332 [Coniferiporia weirii]|nr:hypothetical protein M0805_006332 [Coniferiporia weirii]